MPNHKTSLPALACVMGVAFAGCGSSSSSGQTVSPQAYVKSVCTAIGPFEKDIQQRSSSLNIAGIQNPAQGKQALQSFLTAATADTSHAVTQLQAAGTPDVANGPRIASAIVGVFSQLSRALGRASGLAAHLPTGSPTAFRASAQALGGAVRGSMGSIGQGLQGLRNAKLEKAAAKEPACQTIGS